MQSSDPRQTCFFLSEAPGSFQADGGDLIARALQKMDEEVKSFQPEATLRSSIGLL
jgi:hypothetical protein